MATNLSSSSLNLVVSSESGGKGICNVKDLLLSRAHEFFVVVGKGVPGYICKGHYIGRPEAGRA